MALGPVWEGRPVLAQRAQPKLQVEQPVSQELAPAGEGELPAEPQL